MSGKPVRSQKTRVTRHSSRVERASGATDDLVTIEEPMEIRLDFGPRGGRLGKSISVTMRTPGDDFELALGFLFGEGIISTHDAVESVERCGPPAPGREESNVVRVRLAPEVDVDLMRLQRNFLSNSSCGVCGKASLEAVPQPDPLAPIPTGPRVGATKLQTFPELLVAKQSAFAQTGGIHGVGVFDAEGTLLHCREDVGRHNAVDKIVGLLLARGEIPAGPRILLVSGRSSFEILQKAIRAGFPLVAAVGAPSSLAIALAERHRVTLVGFLRGDGFNVYAGPERIG